MLMQYTGRCGSDLPPAVGGHEDMFVVDNASFSVTITKTDFRYSSDRYSTYAMEARDGVTRTHERDEQPDGAGSGKSIPLFTAHRAGAVSTPALLKQTGGLPGAAAARWAPRLMVRGLMTNRVQVREYRSVFTIDGKRVGPDAEFSGAWIGIRRPGVKR
jgi:hypothetical protein